MAGNFFGGAPTLSWSRRTENGEYVDRTELQGVIRGGVIVDIAGQQQATDMVTGKPAWWEPPQGDNPGRPKLQYVLTVRADGSHGGARDERQTGVINDTGDRRLFIPDGDMRKAIGDAFRANGCQDLHVGDELYVAWIGYRPSKVGGKPAKTWAAKHVKGVAPAQQWPQDGEQGGTAAQAPANPFGQQAPAQGPAQPTAEAPAAPAAPPANPFGGPLPTPEPVASQATNPFA